MFNILILSHGNLAKSFYETCEMIMGKLEGVSFCGLLPGESLQEFEEQVIKLADELYTEDGLLVLIDLYGGTPNNLAIMKLLNRYQRVYLVSGLNLPILLEALGTREILPLEDALDSLVEVGKDGVKDVNKLVLESMECTEEDE